MRLSVALGLKMTQVIEKVQQLIANLQMKSKKNLTAMHVGEKHKLYVIPNQYLSSIMFQALLCHLKDEEKIEVQNKEPITLPYSTWLFESILQLVKEEKAANDEEAKECSPCCFQY